MRILLGILVGGGGSKHNGLFIGAELGVSAQLGKTNRVTRVVANPGTTTQTTTTDTNQDFFPLGAVGLKFGYTHFFNKWVGLRGYATYHYVYNHSSSKTNTDIRTTTTATGQLTAAENNPQKTTQSGSTLASYHQVAANIEAVFKFAEVGNTAVGGFVGLGAGYADSYTREHAQSTNGAGTITTTQGPSGFVLPVNVGLEVYMGKRHNASLNFRLPTIATDLVTTTTDGLTITKNELRQLIITLGYYYKF